MSKFQTWYDNLPEHTKEYLKAQPIWHDSDMFKAFAVGIIVGIIIGAIL
jgi:hypothetical protein